MPQLCIFCGATRLLVIEVDKNKKYIFYTSNNSRREKCKKLIIPAEIIRGKDSKNLVKQPFKGWINNHPQTYRKPFFSKKECFIFPPIILYKRLLWFTYHHAWNLLFKVRSEDVNFNEPKGFTGWQDFSKSKKCTGCNNVLCRPCFSVIGRFRLRMYLPFW